MGSLRVEFVPESHVNHVRGVWAMAGRADLERALRGGGRSRCARLAGRHDVAERWILGTRRRLFAVRLAHHRHRVGSGGEPGPLDPTCYACGMVRTTLVRDVEGEPRAGCLLDRGFTQQQVSNAVEDLKPPRAVLPATRSQKE